MQLALWIRTCCGAEVQGNDLPPTGEQRPLLPSSSSEPQLYDALDWGQVEPKTTEYSMIAKGSRCLLRPPCCSTTLNVEGQENLRKDGEFLIIANHGSNFDGPLLAELALPRRINFWAKTELFNNPAKNWLFKDRLGQIPIERNKDKPNFEKINSEARETSVNLLGNGHIVGVFPAGTRHMPGKEKKKPDTGFIRTWVSADFPPLVRASIRGSGEITSGVPCLRCCCCPHEVEIKILEPIGFDELKTQLGETGLTRKEFRAMVERDDKTDEKAKQLLRDFSEAAMKPIHNEVNSDLAPKNEAMNR